MSKIESKVQEYLKNENTLFQDWYNEFYTAEYPGVPLAAKPNLAKAKETFECWFIEAKSQLFNTICIEWDYPKKRKKYADQVVLATRLADFLISITWKIPSPVATATIVVKMGLDRLCHDCIKGDT